MSKEICQIKTKSKKSIQLIAFFGGKENGRSVDIILSNIENPLEPYRIGHVELSLEEAMILATKLKEFYHHLYE